MSWLPGPMQDETKTRMTPKGGKNEGRNDRRERPSGLADREATTVGAPPSESTKQHPMRRSFWLLAAREVPSEEGMATRSVPTGATRGLLGGAARCEARSRASGRSTQDGCCSAHDVDPHPSGGPRARDERKAAEPTAHEATSPC